MSLDLWNGLQARLMWKLATAYLDEHHEEARAPRAPAPAPRAREPGERSRAANASSDPRRR